MLAWPLFVGDRDHWLYPWDLTVLLVVGPGSSKKGYGCSVQKSVKQDIYLVGTLGVLPWDCEVLGTLEPISVNVAMHL